MAKMKILDWTAYVLTTIGALNWGLVAMNPSWDLVAMLLGAGSMLARVVYGLVGIAGLYSVWTAIKLIKK